MNLLARFVPLTAAAIALLAASRADAANCEPKNACVCNGTPPATILEGIYHDEGPLELELLAVHGDPQGYLVGDVVELDEAYARGSIDARNGDRILAYVDGTSMQPGSVSTASVGYLVIQADSGAVLCSPEGNPLDPEEVVEFALSETCDEDSEAAGFDYSCEPYGTCTLGEGPGDGWSGLLLLFGLFGAHRARAAARRRDA